MISEEDKKRTEEAKTCEGCIGWHKHCNAECCRQITLNISVDNVSEFSSIISITPNHKLNLDEIQYFKYHGVDYIRGKLRFKKENVFIVNRNIVYMKDCNKLKDNLCILPFEDKPFVCRDLSLETIGKNNNYSVTDNCLFRYKCKGGNNHE